MSYDVFISYSRKDYYDETKKCVIEGNIVSKIIELFGNNKITYWFDKDGIYSGDKFPEVISKAIKESKLFLFLATENSNASDWTSMEISTAHLLKKKIIPFRVDESIYADSVLLYMSRLDHIEYFQDENVAFKSLINSIKNYLEELDKKDKEAESKIKKAEKIADLRSEIVRLKNLQDSLESDIKKTMASIREDKRTYNERAKKIEEAEDELYMLQHGSKREYKPIDLFFDDEDKLKERIKQLENQIVDLNEEKKSLQSKINVLEKNEEDYKKRNEDISEKLKNLEKEVEELRKQLAFSNKERDNLKIQFAGAGTELERLKNENAKCKKDLDSERSRRAELEKNIENMFGELVLLRKENVQCKGILISNVLQSLIQNKEKKLIDGKVNFKDKTKMFNDEIQIINGHEAIDLGLPSGTLWAACNVGAQKIENNGVYYNWYDAVDSASSWGDSWRMPSISDFKELKTICVWTWISQKGDYGYRVTGPNGNSIFLPAAGYYNSVGFNNTAWEGNYWSKTPNAYNSNNAYNLYISSDKVCVYNYGDLAYRRSVRLVCNL